MLSIVRNSSSSLFRTGLCTLQTRAYASAPQAGKAGGKRRVGNEIAVAAARGDDLYKRYKPITPGIRHLIRPRNDHLWEGKPLRELTVPRRKNGGRNNRGRITVRHIGGGHKQRIRVVDYHRHATGLCDVIRIEYDPTRSAHLALIRNREPETPETPVWSYIVAPSNLRAGHTVQSFRSKLPEELLPPKPTFEKTRQDDPNLSEEDIALRSRLEEQDQAARESLAMGLMRAKTIQPGNVLPLRLIPNGTVVYNISLRPEGPAVLIRSAGSSGMIMGFDDSIYAHVRLQSGEIRKIHRDCHATIGGVSNKLWKNRSLGKAGRSRNLGIRPSVRGVAMNKCVSLQPCCCVWKC